MEVPRGFTRCNACEGEGEELSEDGYYVGPCPSCLGSGLVPTEKLREEAWHAVCDYYGFTVDRNLVDAVLRSVARHTAGDDE